MAYSVLSFESSIWELFKANKPSLQLQEIFESTRKCLEWLWENPDNRVIIYMPFDERERIAIWSDLSEVYDKCIGLDPAITAWKSAVRFRKIFTADLRIISQVRDIIENKE